VAGKITILDRTLEDTLPYLYGLLGLIEEDDPLVQMDAQIRRRRTLEALKRILLREPLSQPLMIAFEDLHWIDDETQAFLNLRCDTRLNKSKPEKANELLVLRFAGLRKPFLEGRPCRDTQYPEGSIRP
jgi:predicted ATPase